MKNFTGLTIHQYHIMQQLGHGGMAAVYKAYDTRQDRDVAVKMIRVDDVPPEFLPQVIARFQKEAELQTRFQHPNIVPIYDFGDFEGIPYLVLEYLPGGTLKQRMRRPLSLRSAIRVLSPIADALGYAHSMGVIHRDVKPSNILFNNQRMPLLSDFGTAMVLEPGKNDPAGLGVGVGTPAYMAPEQWRGIAVPQTDIYALGVVMFEILTGTRPYTADTPIAVALKQAGEPIPNPRHLVNGLPEQVEHFLYRALAKDINNRFGSMAEMRVALERLAQLQPVEEQKAATVVYETRNEVGNLPRPPADMDIPGKTEPVDIFYEQPVETRIMADRPGQKDPAYPDQIPALNSDRSLPPETPQQDAIQGSEQQPIPGGPGDVRKPAHARPHPRPIPITDTPLPNQAPTLVTANKAHRSPGRGFTWLHILLLALAWGLAHLLKGLVVTWLTSSAGVEMATTLATALAWLVGGLAVGWVFHKAVNLDSTRVALLPTTFAFISGLSMLIGYIINAAWGWVFSAALLWGLIGLVVALAFKPQGKLDGNGIAGLAIGWAVAGIFSALMRAFQLDVFLPAALGSGLGYLAFGLLSGLLLGSVMGLAAGLVFVKPLQTEWWRVIVLTLLWSFGMALGIAVYEWMANGLQSNFVIASGLGWAIRIFFIFAGIRLVLQVPAPGVRSSR